MKVKLELEFENLGELRTYLDQTVQPMVSITPASDLKADPIITAPASTEAISEAPPLNTEPVEAPAVSPVEPATTTEPSTPTPEPAPSPAVSTAATSYTLDELARAGSDLVDQGKQGELPGLLQRFGITSLPELPKEKYGEFATAMRELGANI